MHPRTPNRTPRARRAAAAIATTALAATTVAVQSLSSDDGPVEAASPASSALLADFEPDPPAEFFVFNGGGSSVTTTPTPVADTDALARPGQVGDNGVLEVDYSVTDFGGFGQAFELAGAQDWSRSTSFDFWFHGTGSGLAYQAELSENRSDPGLDTSERWDFTFVDDVVGWRYLTIPFTDFTRATDFQPAGAPDDGFTGEEIWAWAFVLPQGVDVVAFDDVGIGYRVIDDFESGLPTGTDPDGIGIGYPTFSGTNSTVDISTTTTPPGPVLPAQGGEPNQVLQMDIDSALFAGFIHAFADDALTTWTPQDWSAASGFRFWFHGEGSGAPMFIDLLDNRNPGSTSDDAERWTTTFTDSVAGWRLIEMPFDGFSRKEIGNGAPNDGLNLTEVHGWALGSTTTDGARTFYVDDVALYGVGEIPELAVSFGTAVVDVPEGTTGQIPVRLNRPMTEDDPAEVTVRVRSDEATSTIRPGRDYTPIDTVLTFVNGDVTEQSVAVETFDDDKSGGFQRVALRLSEPVGAEPGFITSASALVIDDDPVDRFLIDDFELGAYLWDADGATIDVVELTADDPGAVPDQGPYETVAEVTTPLIATASASGSLCGGGNGVVPVTLYGSETFDVADVDHTTIRVGDAAETHTSRSGVKRHESDENGDGFTDLVIHVRRGELDACGGELPPVTGSTVDGADFVAGGDDATVVHDFAIDQDWTRGQALSFWYEGTGSGDEIGVVLKENRAPDPGPTGWSMVWSDEFDDPAGTPPNPEFWNYEIGDVTPDGKNGWGNEELQYYTDDPANAATDGQGNLALTLRAADDGSLQCYYGDCEYTSARLTTWNKAEFAYGRIESRILVPEGAGIWPAFWSLGTDIDEVLWPQTGEIDFMEFVGRLPNEIFGTIHGPGYAGGASFAGIYDFGEPVFDEYHTFAVEWEPDLIRWYVDDILYHTATPADVAPNEWVFNDPVFFLLNVAIGGNFGGTIGDDFQAPQSMLVDYVRVYQGPDTAERWEASFTDDVAGWSRVTIPFTDLQRSADQPAGAPDDGLTLDEVWGYGFTLPEGGTTAGSFRIDEVRVDPVPPPTEILVTSTANGGEGSLRQALADIADGGTITFDPALAGGTIGLTTGPLVPSGAVTIDAADAPGLTVDGGGVDRVLVVDAGRDVTIRHLTLANGYGFQLAGGVLNNGTLTLDHAMVTGNTMTTDAGDFWQGGGGIYSGDGATLNLIDSTVSGNFSGWTGGGVYSFFNTTTNVVRSTITGNTSSDVGGGLRLLGDGEIVNSTISGNTGGAWHGGALFLTDGELAVTNTTITANTSGPDARAVFVGTFTDASAAMTLQNSIVGGDAAAGCFLAPFGAGAVSITSLGGNVFTDDTCFPGAADQIVTDLGVEPLADNGGPTLTHALVAGSPAIDAADPTACPAVDQRGVTRDGACDVGSFEYAP